MSLSLHELYHDAGTFKFSTDDQEALLNAFDKAARHIFNKKIDAINVDDINGEETHPLFEAIKSFLQGGVDGAIAQSVPYAMRRALTEDVHVFSGAKTYAELKELGELLMDGDKVKPFNQFWQDTRKIHSTYNKSYLSAEYNFATQSARMASKWSEVEGDGDRYDLQYRTANDDRVRDEHQTLNGTTLPPSDPFWDEYYPPNGWNCRCTTVQVRKGKYQSSNSGEAIKAGADATSGKNVMFRFNPGKRKVIFPSGHPYVKRLSKEELKAIRKAAHDVETWTTIPTREGKVTISSNHGKDEAAENIGIATYLANTHKYEIELMGRVEGKRTADSFNKTLGITQEYKVNTTPTRSAIDNAIRSAVGQSSNIVLEVRSDISDGDLINAIRARVRREKDVRSVNVIRNGKDKTYMRDEITNDGWTL